MNVKKKGNRGELKICKSLNERFGSGFNRVPNSGAYGATHLLQESLSKALCGDIICPERFKFCIEVKNGYNIDLQELFNNKACKFYSFIDQCLIDCKRTNLLPMIIYIKDRRKPLSIVLNECLNFNKVSCAFNFVYENKYWTILDFEQILNNAPLTFWFT